MSIWEQLKWYFKVKGVYNEAVEKTEESGMDTKSIFKSRVFWFNLALGALGVVQEAGVVNFLPEPYGPAMLQAISAVNIVLRYFTKMPVTVLPQAKVQQ